jgi:hypothetical protein
MGIVKEKYTEQRINQLHQLLLNDNEKQKSRDYDIKVDDLKVVQRTNDVDNFFKHEDFIDYTTKSVTINLYDGCSRRCTRYQLYFGEALQQNSVTLAGIENAVQEKLDARQKQLDYENLVKSNTDLKEQLSEAEDYIEQLENNLNSEKEKKLNIKDNIGDFAAKALEGLLRNNVHWFTNVPALNGISDAIKQDNQVLQNQANDVTTTTEAEPTVTFTKKKDVVEQEIVATETEKQILEYIKIIQQKFSTAEVEKVLDILEILAEEKENIDIVYELLEA